MLVELPLSPDLPIIGVENTGLFGGGGGGSSARSIVTVLLLSLLFFIMKIEFYLNLAKYLYVVNNDA